MSACQCLPGYTCSYVKTQTAIVSLPMTIAEFETVRQDFVNAVALSAGVSPDRIIIISVSQSGGRRGMEARRIEIRVNVDQATTLRGLDASLRRHGLPRTVRRPFLESVNMVTARSMS
jgi:hypothetical protein